MMTKQTQEALKMAIEALEEAEDIIEGKTTQGGYFYKAIQACKEALALSEKQHTFPDKKQPAQSPVACMFVNNDGECEEIGHLREHYDGVIPDDFMPLYTHSCVLTHTAPTIELKPANIAKARDEIYYAWRKYWAWGIPSKDGEAVFNANGDGFQAGWLACEEWINKEKNNA